MVKHTQIIRRQQPTNYLSVFDHFVGIALKGLTSNATKLLESTERKLTKEKNGENKPQLLLKLITFTKLKLLPKLPK